jgi:hypothetical protein
MKYLCALLALVCFTLFADAQTFGVSFSGAVPTGEFKHLANAGYTANATVQVPVFGFTGVLVGGYEFWDEKSNPTAKELNFTNFPVVLAGARSYFGDFYLSTLAGIFPVKLTSEFEGEKIEEKETQGAILAKLGTVFPVSFFHADVSIFYLWTQDYPQIGLNLGVLFNK